MVGSYKEIEAKMNEGTVNRTVASTNMNATSSRAHTIVGINFVQKTKNSAGKEMAKGAVINLVDLAGRYVILFWYTPNSGSYKTSKWQKESKIFKNTCFEVLLTRIQNEIIFSQVSDRCYPAQ